MPLVDHRGTDFAAHVDRLFLAHIAATNQSAAILFADIENMCYRTMRELVVGLGMSDEEVAKVCAMLKLPPEVMSQLAVHLVQRPIVDQNIDDPHLAALTADVFVALGLQLKDFEDLHAHSLRDPTRRPSCRHYVCFPYVAGYEINLYQA